MTIFTERCKNNIKKALQDYDKMRKDANDRIKSIRQDYGEEASQKEREMQEKRMQVARKEAEQIINQAYNDAVEFNKKNSVLDGSKLTDDIKLLDAGIVNPDDFELLKEKYSDNITMLTALKKYGEEKNANMLTDRNGISLNRYDVSGISLLPDRLKNWNTLNKMALDSLDMIDGTGNYSDSWNQSLGKIFFESGIENFGEGVDL